MLNLSLAIASIVMLAPLALYLVGRIRDPFHPLIFVGVLSYFLVPDRAIFRQEATLEIADQTMLVPYIVASTISVLGIYAGWFWAGRRLNRQRLSPPPSFFYDVPKLVIFAIVFMIVANISHVLYKDIPYDPSISGYARDLSRLWIAAAILTVQAILLTHKGNRLPLFGLLILTLYPPLERFIHYGQRGDTFRLAMLVALWYLMVGRRPAKVVFVAGACVLGLTLATLALTRDLVNDGDAPNRFAAMAQVIPQFVKGNLSGANASDEEIFGAAIMETVRQERSYGYGLSLTVGFVGRFLPRQLFPNKDQYVTFTDAYDPRSLHADTGLVIPGGAAPSGFAMGFAELAWACPLIWLFFGYFYRRFWMRAAEIPDMRHIGYFAGFTMAALYSISQDLLTGELNLVYILLPLWLVYRIARLPASVSASQPALASL